MLALGHYLRYSLGCGLAAPESSPFLSWTLDLRNCGSAQPGPQSPKQEGLQELSGSQKHLAKPSPYRPLGIFPFPKLKFWMLGWWKNPNPWSTFKFLLVKVRETSFSSWRKRWQCSRNWVSVEAGIFRTVSRTQNVLEIKYTETNLDQKVLSDGSCKPNRVSFMMKRCGNTWTALSFFPAPSVTSFWKLRLHFVLLYSSELLTEKTSNVCWNLVLPVC